MRHGSTPLRVAACLLSLSAIARTNAAEPGLSDDRLGSRTAPLLLLTRADVRDDLQLSAEQREATDRIIRELYQRAEAIRGQGNTPQVLAERRAIDDAQRDWMRSTLSVEQQARLLQVDLQWEGPAALVTRPKVAEAIGLSPEQLQALGAAVNRRRAAGAAQRDADRILAEQTLAVLSPEQREHWKALLGRPITFGPARTSPSTP